MRSIPTQTARPRSARAVLLGVVVALALPVAAHGVEDAPGASLCDAVTAEALGALGPLKYAEPTAGAPVYCLYEAAGDGSHSLTLALSTISFELMRGPDAVIYDIAGRPALEFEGSLLVDLGEDTLAVTPMFEDSPDAGGLDLVEYAIAVAEAAVPSLSIAVEETPAAAMAPPTVEGIEWTNTDVRSMAAFIEEDESQAAVWLPLLERLGAEPADATVLNASGRDVGSDERIGTYTAIAVSGVEGDQLRTAMTDWLLSISGEGAAMEDVSVGGKGVTALVADGELRGYLYVEGNTAHAIPGPEDLGARILATLP